MDGTTASKDKQWQIILLVATTAAVLVIGILYNLSSSSKPFKSKAPPRVTSYIPFLGCALEFGADCRAFLKKHFRRLHNTPIMTATIAGKDYHFLDTSSGAFHANQIFRHPSLTFRLMANDALVHGFGIAPELLEKANGIPAGDSKQLNAVYHHHLMKPVGLEALLNKAQLNLATQVFNDPSLYPSGSSESKTTVPLYDLIQQSLFRATIGAAISDSLVATPELASESLQEFSMFDDKFPLLLSKLPVWMFPNALKGRIALQEKCRGPAFYKGLSGMIQHRNQVAKDDLHIDTEEEIGDLSMILIWAAAANTMPAGFWLIYHLLLHKTTALKAIQEEIVELYESRSTTTSAAAALPLTVPELNQLLKLESALTETLRLYSESMIARDVTEDCELNLNPSSGSDSQEQHVYAFKKGSRVAMMMSCLHMDDTVFGTNAHEFQWDRFLADPVTTKPPVFTKFGKVLPAPVVRPFGGGVSMCPGRKFASYEIKAFVAELLYRFELEFVVSGNTEPLKTDPRQAGLGIHVPLQDMDVRITRRQKVEM